MPVRVAKRGSKYVVADRKGKVTGKPTTKARATKRAAAINRGKHRSQHR